MTVISLVYAQSRNGVIGDDGGLPWHLPSDLKRFKETTFGKPVIMGRKTWDGLPRKPLPGRMNIVMTRHRILQRRAQLWCQVSSKRSSSWRTCPKFASLAGARFTACSCRWPTRIYLTEIDVDVAGRYAMHPVLDARQWQEVVAIAAMRVAKKTAPVL